MNNELGYHRLYAPTHLIVPTAWAYSSEHNNRRLEHHFHGMWNIVFQDLIHDLRPYVFVVPQYKIDSIDHGPVRPDDSIATIAQSKAEELIPDFAILKGHVIPRRTATTSINNTQFTLWNNFKVKKVIVPIIAELKRPPTRRPLSLDVFIEELVSLFEKAYDCLEEQVEKLFETQPNIEERMLIACVGEWWSWKVVTRDTTAILPGSSDEDPNDSSGESDDPKDPDYRPSARSEKTPNPREKVARKAKDDIKPRYTNSRVKPLGPSDMVSYTPPVT
jgi:hypothetical protein